MKIRNLAYATFVTAAAVALVIGSAVPSEAAKKKKAAAAAPPPPAVQPVSCLVTAPGSVCAAKGGQKFTYFNTCYAAQDGAKSAKAGACKETKSVSAKSKKKKA